MPGEGSVSELQPYPTTFVSEVTDMSGPRVGEGVAVLGTEARVLKKACILLHHSLSPWASLPNSVNRQS